MFLEPKYLAGECLNNVKGLISLRRRALVYTRQFELIGTSEVRSGLSVTFQNETLLLHVGGNFPYFRSYAVLSVEIFRARGHRQEKSEYINQFQRNKKNKKTYRRGASLPLSICPCRPAESIHVTPCTSRRSQSAATIHHFTQCFWPT